jgi:hypothetical protein
LTTSTRLPLREDEALVICGGMNRRREDRFLPPEAVHAVYVATSDELAASTWFDQHEPRTVTSLVWLPDRTNVVYATESQLFKLDTATGSAELLAVGGLDDIHELTGDGERVLVANTGFDEIVELGLPDCRVTNRYPLGPFRGTRCRPDPRSTTESFHANQAVVADDGALLALVHHCGGFRRLSNTRRKLVRHGNGGTVNLETGETHNLGLHGPHSLRRRGTEWVVADSGRHELLFLSRTWEVERRIKLSGWSRGLDFVGNDKIAIGISATTRRYARRGDRAKTGIEMVEAATGRRWWSPCPDMEKVMWVQHCPRQDAEKLLALRRRQTPSLLGQH